MQPCIILINADVIPKYRILQKYRLAVNSFQILFGLRLALEQKSYDIRRKFETGVISRFEYVERRKGALNQNP